jgi:membrane-associated HD superfamily phosphohydrolase
MKKVMKALMMSINKTLAQMLFSVVCMLSVLCLPINAHAQYSDGGFGSGSILTNPIYQAALFDDDEPNARQKNSKPQLSAQELQKKKEQEQKTNHNTQVFLEVNFALAAIIFLYFFFIKGRNIFSVRDGLK